MEPRRGREGSDWCNASLEDESEPHTPAIRSSGPLRPRPRRGDDPERAPDQIACFASNRLVESTRHELEHWCRAFRRRRADPRRLRPLAGRAPGGRRVPGGNGLPLLLSRIDYTGRIAVMPGLPGRAEQRGRLAEGGASPVAGRAARPLLSSAAAPRIRRGAPAVDRRPRLPPARAARHPRDPPEYRGPRRRRRRRPGRSRVGERSEVEARPRSSVATCSSTCRSLPATALLDSLVAPDGHLILSVPRRFPYHPDPIDTMYRPSVAELVRVPGHASSSAGARSTPAPCWPTCAAPGRSGGRSRTGSRSTVSGPASWPGGRFGAGRATRPGSSEGPRAGDAFRYPLRSHHGDPRDPGNPATATEAAAGAGQARSDPGRPGGAGEAGARVRSSSWCGPGCPRAPEGCAGWGDQLRRCVVLEVVEALQLAVAARHRVEDEARDQAQEGEDLERRCEHREREPGHLAGVRVLLRSPGSRRAARRGRRRRRERRRSGRGEAPCRTAIDRGGCGTRRGTSSACSSVFASRAK